MKNLKSSLVLLMAFAGFGLARAQEEAAPAAPPTGTKLIVDLRTELPGLFSYGTWEGKLTITKSGYAVHGKGAQGNGGMGREISPSLDFNEVEFVEVALGTVVGNEVPYVTIAFNDADGTQYAARVLVDQLVPGQPVWLRVRRQDFRLNSTEPGDDSRMNWSQVTRWHLQGDWTTQKPMHAIFVALRMRR